MNACTFYGRVGRDPEVKAIGDKGTQVASFSIAVNTREKDAPLWLDCSVWGKRAEVIGNYVTKGSALVVTGELECRKWEDKDGNKRERWSLNVRDFTFGSKGADKPKPAAKDAPEFDDVPF